MSEGESLYTRMHSMKTSAAKRARQCRREGVMITIQHLMYENENGYCKGS